MKTKLTSLVIVFLLGTVAVFAQSKTEEFKVNGNCGMCKARIEKAAKTVDGVSSAAWNQDTKGMAVKLDSTKTNVHKVEMAIALAGHDTEMHKATDEAYNKLPGCCKYDRSVNLGESKMDMKKKESHEGNMH
ncbi:MAG: cation transporter [Prolixibacteraceae bacterium]|jgi:mercuric ion binding protein|nr:cation transporter [Prolixibacteraceae bacterium]